jgi:hypothetical protein
MCSNDDTNKFNGKKLRRHTTGSPKQFKRPKSKSSDCPSVSSTTSNVIELAPKSYADLKSCILREQKPASPEGKTSSRSKVSFNTIEIREYARTVGDHPCVKSGPALSLGWVVVDSCIMPLSAYEYLRLPRVGEADLIVPHSIRTEVLLEQGVTRHEMVLAIRESVWVKQNRNQTLQQTRYQDSFAGLPFKALSRILAYAYGRIGPVGKTEKQVELLLQQAKRAKQLRDQLRQLHLTTVGNEDSWRTNDRKRTIAPVDI